MFTDTSAKSDKAISALTAAVQYVCVNWCWRHCLAMPGKKVMGVESGTVEWGRKERIPTWERGMERGRIGRVISAALTYSQIISLFLTFFYSLVLLCQNIWCKTKVTHERTIAFPKVEELKFPYLEKTPMTVPHHRMQCTI